MKEIYLCPDCRGEHAEPHDAIIGHLVRCVSCVMLLELLAQHRALSTPVVEIGLAA